VNNYLVVLACVGKLFLGAVSARSADIPAPGPPDPSAVVSPEAFSFKGIGVVAYYFHVNARCQTCLLIEKRSGEVIKDAFIKELQEGILDWRAVNTQQSENRRFIADLRLPSRGLVLVAYMDGTPGRWKNLESVWQLVHGDQVAFQQYVSREVCDFLDVKP
jgi:hypothetical protein